MVGDGTGDGQAGSQPAFLAAKAMASAKRADPHPLCLVRQGWIYGRTGSELKWIDGWMI